MPRLTLLVTLSLWIAVPSTAQVTITRTPDAIRVDIDNEPFTVFHIGGQHLNRPYLHPLRTASGKILTRSLPAGQIAGETTDHPHHAGLFYGHGDVNGFNYWAIRNEPPTASARETMGRIVVDEVTSTSSGGGTGTIGIVLTWLKPDGEPLLTETRTMTFHAHPELRIVDFDIELAAIERAEFRDTKEGTFALRMATALDELPPTDRVPARTGTGKLRNAQGAEGEANVWGKRSEWVDYAGELDGERVGVVMMDHPGNPRHPTYWHSRGYGLHAINPFGVSDFLNDKTQNGSLAIDAGGRVRFRYRVIVHQGVSPARLAALYQEYAATETSAVRE
jgi:hypothetical protein